MNILSRKTNKQITRKNSKNSKNSKNNNLPKSITQKPYIIIYICGQTRKEYIPYNDDNMNILSLRTIPEKNADFFCAGNPIYVKVFQLLRLLFNKKNIIKDPFDLIMDFVTGVQNLYTTCQLPHNNQNTFEYVSRNIHFNLERKPYTNTQYMQEPSIMVVKSSLSKDNDYTLSNGKSLLYSSYNLLTQQDVFQYWREQTPLQVRTKMDFMLKSKQIDLKMLREFFPDKKIIVIDTNNIDVVEDDDYDDYYDYYDNGVIDQNFNLGLNPGLNTTLNPSLNNNTNNNNTNNNNTNTRTKPVDEQPTNTVLPSSPVSFLTEPIKKVSSKQSSKKYSKKLSSKSPIYSKKSSKKLSSKTLSSKKSSKKSSIKSSSKTLSSKKSSIKSSIKSSKKSSKKMSIDTPISISTSTLPSIEPQLSIENEPELSIENEPELSIENEPELSIENEPEPSIESPHYLTDRELDKYFRLDPTIEEIIETIDKEELPELYNELDRIRFFELNGKLYSEFSDSSFRIFVNSPPELLQYIKENNISIPYHDVNNQIININFLPEEQYNKVLQNTLPNYYKLYIGQ